MTCGFVQSGWSGGLLAFRGCVWWLPLFATSRKERVTGRSPIRAVLRCCIDTDIWVIACALGIFTEAL